MCGDAVPGAGDTRMTKLQFMPQNSDSLLERQVTDEQLLVYGMMRAMIRTPQEHRFGCLTHCGMW